MAIVMPARMNVTSSKFKNLGGAKFNQKTWKQRQLLSEFGFVLHIAPP